jgi:toxin ParE1/3/4
MKRARFLAPARREFLAQVAYYQNEVPGLGARFVAAVEDATARALAFPLTGSVASKDVRRVFVYDFPFAIVYRPQPDGILVVAVAHHSRRPEYWHDRVHEAADSTYSPVGTNV